MFLIDRGDNKAISIEKKTFKELAFKERKHLQEWIRKNTAILGERLLIIQKEFSGFDDTRERLDLLAIDEDGNLVIIENKLDDSGRDVVWQSLKYASYCSVLTKTNIKEIFQRYLDEQGKSDNAEDLICDYLDIDDFNDVELNNDSQRIILIAANFRKEVTSTAMWLLDHNIKIKCIKVTPYELNGQILLDSEQIIPVVDAEEYMIKIANKKQEELLSKERNKPRHDARRAFWAKLLENMNMKSNLFKNVSPSKDTWLGCGSGHTGLHYTFTATGSYARVELWMNTGSKEETKELFDRIYEYKDKIEKAFGDQLDWQRLDEGKGSRIAYRQNDVSVYNEGDWMKMIDFMTTNMIKFEQSIKVVLVDVKSN